MSKTLRELLMALPQDLVLTSEGLNLQQIESFNNSEVSTRSKRRRNQNPVVGKIKQEVKYYDMELRGQELSVPYIASSTTTFVREGNKVKEDRLPVWINHLIGDNLHPGRGRVKQAKISIARECAQQIRNQLTLKLRSFSAPVSVSNELAPDQFKVLYDMFGTPCRILVNEEVMTTRAIDADGDRAYLIYSEDGMTAMFGKFPFTKKALVLKKHEGPLFEQFRDIELKDVIEEEQDEKKVFFKCHTNVNIGILTQQWNSYESWNTLKKKSWSEKVRVTFSDSGRYEDIEGNGLQGVRNDAKSVGTLGQMNIDGKATHLLRGLSRVMLTSASGINKLHGADLESTISMPLEKFVDKYVKLNLVPYDDPEKGIKGDFAKPTAGFDSMDANIKWELADSKLIDRVFRAGRMKAELIGEHHSGLPIVKITLTTKEGHPVGLVDQKRDSYDLPDKGLGFHYLLPPVYSMKRGKWVSGLAHMVDSFYTYKAMVWNTETGQEELVFKNWLDYKFVIKNPVTNECAGFFPRLDKKPVSDWNNPGLKVMVDDLMEALSAYCGIYGSLVNSGENREEEMISPNNLIIVQNIMLVDYGHEHSVPDSMYPIFQEAQEALPEGMYLCPGNKQTNMKVRKYAMALDNNVAIWGDRKAHPGRTGKMLAQLSRALHKGSYKVAIIQCNTESQCFFTNSGVEKQSHVKAFYNQVMTDINEAEAYAERHGLKLEDLHETEIYSWNGTKKIVWVTSPKQQIALGKFIDGKYGMKFMPREIMGAKIMRDGKAGKTIPDRIDALIPMEELISKGCYNAVMDKAVMEEIQITQLYNGEYHTTNVKAMVLDMNLYRSGSHSENTQASHGIMRVGGFDQFAMYPGLIEMGYTDPDAEFGIPTPNWDYVEALRKCFRDIQSIQNVNKSSTTTTTIPQMKKKVTA